MQVFVAMRLDVLSGREWFDLGTVAFSAKAAQVAADASDKAAGSLFAKRNPVVRIAKARIYEERQALQSNHAEGMM